MSRTVQAVINRAWEILQDDGTRYPASSLITHIVDAVQQARDQRPDLFVGVYDTPLPASLTTTDLLPLPDQFFAAVAYYVSGCAELRDDEWAVDGRAVGLRAALQSKLLTGM